MRIKYFREFIVLSKYLNFSLAADHLHMTQPGLSRHISAMERELGVIFFERDTHKVKLTEKGEQFLKGLEKIIEDYDFLCETVQTGGLEKITIGVPYYGVNRYLSQVMSSFKSAFPEIKINYLPSYPDEIIAALFAKQIDIAVLPEANFRGAENLVIHRAFEEPVVLLMNKHHSLAGQKGVFATDLRDEKFIILKGNWGHSLFECWHDFCREHKLSLPQETQETKSIEEAALNMKPESGVMLLPEHLKEVNISEDVTFVDILDEDCQLTISLIHHPRNQNPVTKKFLDFYLDTTETG